MNHNVELFEQFIVLLYDRTTTHTSVNQARKELFAQKGRAIDLIPPTQAALIQHVKRATYQAGYCWSQSCNAAPEMPFPSVRGGPRMTLESGMFFGQIYPKQLRPVENSFDVGAKKDVAGNVNVSKLHSSVLHCVSVQEIVTLNKYLCMTHITQL